MNDVARLAAFAVAVVVVFALGLALGHVVAGPQPADVPATTVPAGPPATVAPAMPTTLPTPGSTAHAGEHGQG